MRHAQFRVGRARHACRFGTYKSRRLIPWDRRFRCLTHIAEHCCQSKLIEKGKGGLSTKGGYAVPYPLCCSFTSAYTFTPVFPACFSNLSMFEDSWPHVVIDMLEACDDPRSAWHRRRNLFLPLTTRRGTKRSAADDETDGSQTSHPVENEPGLCDAIISVVARMKSGELLIAPVRLGDLSTGKAPDLPNLSLITQQQDSGFAFQVGAVDVNDIRGGELGAPLLFSSLLRNDTDADTSLAALGHTWIVPRQSACCLCAARRWREMRPIIGCDGYRLMVLDPPWHSKSVQRAAKYTTRHKRDILADLVPAIRCVEAFSLE